MQKLHTGCKSALHLTAGAEQEHSGAGEGAALGPGASQYEDSNPYGGGIAFADTCRTLLHTLRHGINNAKSASGTLNGRVVFGLPSDHYDAAAIRLLSLLNKKQPGIRADLKFFPPNGLLRALDNDTVDFIFFLRLAQVGKSGVPSGL